MRHWHSLEPLHGGHKSTELRAGVTIGGHRINSNEGQIGIHGSEPNLANLGGHLGGDNVRIQSGQITVLAKVSPHEDTDRAKADEHMASKLAQGNGQQLLWMRCIDGLGGGDRTLKHQLSDLLSHIPDSKTKNVPGRFPLVNGLPVVLQENVCLPFNIANGTTGTLVGWLLDSREPAEREGNEHTLKYLPLALFIRLDNPPNHVRFEGLEPGVVPLFPTSIDFTVKYAGVPIVVKRKGFKIGIAIAFTIHKVQGKTLERAIIDLGGRMSYQALVVAMSRVTTADGVRILRDFDRSALVHDVPEMLKSLDTDLDTAHGQTTEKYTDLWARAIRNE